MISGSTLILGDSISVGYGPLLPVSGGQKVIVAKVGAPTEWLLGETEKVRPVFDNVFLLIGTNDVGGGASADAIYHRIRQISDRFATSARVVLMTVPPLKGWANYASRFDAIDAKRRSLNDKIRSTPAVRILDLDKLLADPSDPSKLAPQFDSGDHLHPNPKALATLIDASTGGLSSPSPVSPFTPSTPTPGRQASEESSRAAAAFAFAMMVGATWWFLKTRKV